MTNESKRNEDAGEPLVRLSPSARELLAAMRGGVTCAYMRYMGRFNPTPYYYRSDTHKRCTKQVRTLLESGMIERFDQDTCGAHRVRVTPNHTMSDQSHA